MNNIYKKVFQWILLVPLIVPLLFTPKTTYPWSFGKTLFFFVIVDILGIAYVFFREKYSFPKMYLKKLDIFFAVFVGMLLISSIFGVDFSKSFWGFQSRFTGLYTYIHLLLYYFLLRIFFTEKKDLLLLLKSVVVVGMVSAFFAWFGKYIPFLSEVIPKDSRLSGIVGNPIFFASYLLFPTFFSLYLFFADKEKMKYFWFGSFLILFATLLFTQGRGLFIGLFLSFFIVSIVFALLQKRRRIRYVVLESLFALLAIVISFRALYFANDTVRLYTPNLFQRYIEISFEQTTAQTRLLAWNVAYKGFLEKPVFGWGMENFEYIHDKYYDPAFLNFTFGETRWDKPHNYYLELLSCSGIIGLVSYSVLLFWIIYSLFKFGKDTGLNEKLVLLGLFLVYLIQNVFAFDTINSLIVFVVFLVFISRKFFEEKSINIHFPNWFIKIFSVFFVCLFGYFLLKNIILYNSSVNTSTARDYLHIGDVQKWRDFVLLQEKYNVPFDWENSIFFIQDLLEMEGVDILEKKGSLPENVVKSLEVSLIKKIENVDQLMYKFWLSQLYVLGTEYTDEQYYSKAEKLLSEIVRETPQKPHFAILIGRLFLINNETEKAIDVLQNTLMYGDFPEINWLLGVAYVQNGDMEKGIEHMEKGMEFASAKPSNIQFLIDQYVKVGDLNKVAQFYILLIKNDSTNAVKYYGNLAATYMELGDIENSIKYLNLAVEGDPSLASEAKQFLKDNNINIEEYAHLF